MAKVKLAILFCILAQAFANSEVESAPRIIGGTDATSGSTPYMVSLRNGGLSHFCGGALISADWVLTAKHCIVGGGTISVAAGSDTLDPANVMIKSSSMHVHPDHDIGLVQLSEPFQLSDVIKPVNLPTSDISPNSELRVTGWGSTKYENGASVERPNKLQTLNVVSMVTDDCTAIFADIFQERDLCTVPVVGHGTCVGDSGSPLVANNQIHGVVSRGVPCAYGVPDIYTRVFYHNSWIQETMARK